MSNTVSLYEDNGGGLHIQKDDGPVWHLGVCGAVHGPDPDQFLDDAEAWLKGDWEPSEGDGQTTDGTSGTAGLELIATHDGFGVTIPEQGTSGEPLAGFSGQRYLGITEES